MSEKFKRAFLASGLTVPEATKLMLEALGEQRKREAESKEWKNIVTGLIEVAAVAIVVIVALSYL